MLRRLFSELTLNSVAGVASSLGTRIQGTRTLSELAGLGPYFFFPHPQFLGGMNVIDSNDYSRYHALELKLERRFADGFSYLLGYTLSRSKDTRSFDPRSPWSAQECAVGDQHSLRHLQPRLELHAVGFRSDARLLRAGCVGVSVRPGPPVRKWCQPPHRHPDRRVDAVGTVRRQ